MMQGRGWQPRRGRRGARFLLRLIFGLLAVIGLLTVLATAGNYSYLHSIYQMGQLGRGLSSLEIRPAWSPMFLARHGWSTSQADQSLRAVLRALGLPVRGSSGSGPRP